MVNDSKLRICAVPCLSVLSSDYINGLVQERRNSSALAMELRLSCINLPIFFQYIDMSVTVDKVRIA